MVKTVLIVGITNNYPDYNPGKMKDQPQLADAIKGWVGGWASARNIDEAGTAVGKAFKDVGNFIGKNLFGSLFGRRGSSGPPPNRSSYANLNNSNYSGGQLNVSGLNYGMYQINTSQGKEQPPHMKKLFETWFIKNQYFDAETGVRAGTYVDFTPFKNAFGIKIGEYREFSHKLDYYENKSNYTYNKNHYFEIAASYVVGASFKYNIGESRFESVSLSFLGGALEYSVQSNQQSQIYFGLDTGSSAGIGIGGFANIKGGWQFNF